MSTPILILFLASYFIAYQLEVFLLDKYYLANLRAIEIGRDEEHAFRRAMDPMMFMGFIVFINAITFGSLMLPYNQRMIKYRQGWIGRINRPFSRPISLALLVIATIVLGALLVWSMVGSYLLELGWTSISLLTGGVIVAGMWAMAFGYVYFKLFARVGPIGHAPDLAIVRVLVDAVRATETKKRNNLLNLRVRTEIAANICLAARLLENSMVPPLAHGDKAAEAVVAPCFGAAAGGLREALVCLAAPKADALVKLKCTLGQALIGIATSDFTHFPEARMTVPFVAPLTWRDRILSFARWFGLAFAAAFVVALVWALGAALGWDWVKNTGIQGLAIQFAVLCFIYATFSAFGQPGRDELSGVISSGTSLFNWGKKE
jgi:hypothetical protein